MCRQNDDPKDGKGFSRSLGFKSISSCYYSSIIGSDREVARSYREKELQVQACDWPQSDDNEVKTGLGTLGNRELKQEGEDSQLVCVDVVERELHKHSTGPVNTHIKHTLNRL